MLYLLLKLYKLHQTTKHTVSINTVVLSPYLIHSTILVHILALIRMHGFMFQDKESVVSILPTSIIVYTVVLSVELLLIVKECDLIHHNREQRGTVRVQ